MHPLLQTSTSSELFAQGQPQLTGDGDSPTTDVSDFASILLADTELAKQANSGKTASNNDSADFQPAMMADIGKELQPSDAEDSDAEGAGGASILDLLQQMQALLPEQGESAQGDDQVDDAALLEQALNGEAADGSKFAQLTEKLASVLEQLGSSELSDEQRQQLAAQFVEKLSVEQRQLFADFDSEQLLQQLTNAEGQGEAAEQRIALLTRLQKLNELAQQTLQHVNATVPDDNDAQQVMQQLSQLLQHDDSLTVQQRQQLQALANDLKANLERREQATPSTAEPTNLQGLLRQLESVSAEERPQLLQQLREVVKQSETMSVSQQQQLQKLVAELEQAPAKDFPQLIQRVRDTLPKIDGQSSKSGMSASFMTTTEPATNAELKQLVENAKRVLGGTTDAGISRDDVKVKGTSPDLAGRLVETLATANQQATTATVTSTERTDALPNMVSTQAGPVKSSELSSTLASSMQAIQKPLDPQQAEASQKLQERIQVMLSKNVQRADIRLDPPELGQLHVRVNLSGEQANVQFQVQSAQAKDALESAMPRLREMLQEQGINLADTEVGEQQQQQLAEGGDGSHQGNGHHTDAGEEHEILLDNGKPVALGNVDFYV